MSVSTKEESGFRVHLRDIINGSLKIRELKNIFCLTTTSGEIQTDMDTGLESREFENEGSEAAGVDIKDSDKWIKRRFQMARVPPWALVEVRGRWLSNLSSELRVKQ